MTPECWKRVVARSSAVESKPSISSGDTVTAASANLLSACITILPVDRLSKEAEQKNPARAVREFFPSLLSPLGSLSVRSDQLYVETRGSVRVFIERCNVRNWRR
jgi:hypothetical protein